MKHVIAVLVWTLLFISLGIYSENKIHDFTNKFNSEIEFIQKDIEDDNEDNQHFWYFGRKLDDLILMVRYAHNQFIVQVNVKDFEFALCLDKQIGWKQEFLAQLTA